MATPTFSGLQRMLWSFQERIVSDDFNRAEQFAASALAELLRLPLTAIALESEAEGKTTPAATAGNPLRAIVFEGIRFRPEIGTTTGFVEPGCALVVYPDASPHPADSPARLLLDPGVQSAGTLTLTAGGGGARIDVVECQPTNVVTEADSRDVFDPSTGLFSPQLVNKVARGGLTYRIRTGTPGGGFPGTASGWLPIAVCLVPSSATTWDDCTVWDVRPLLADRARGPHLVSDLFPRAERRHVVVVEPTDAAGQWRAKGNVVVPLGGWRAGGQLATTASGLSHLRLDALDSTLTVQEPGFSVVADRPWYLYLSQPFGLPRWAKLSPASSGQRTPQEPRGIPVFSQKAPSGLGGLVGSALALPTNTGLGGSDLNAVVVASGMFAGSSFAGSTTTEGSVDAYFTVLQLSPSSGANTASPVYTLTAGTHFPMNVTAIRVEVEVLVTLAGGTIVAFDRDVHLANVAETELYSGFRMTGTLAMPVAGSTTDRFSCWLEVPPNMPTGVGQSFHVTVDYSPLAGSPFTLEKIQVKGWRLP